MSRELDQDEIGTARYLLWLHSREDGVLPGCISFLQRKMRIRYDHANRIVTHLEHIGYVTPRRADGTRKLGGAH